jgi:hypothetical protein
MDSSDWSNGFKLYVFDTRPDTEFELHSETFPSEPYLLDPLPLTSSTPDTHFEPNPRFLIQIASHDVASIICEAMRRGRRRCRRA